MACHPGGPVETCSHTIDVQVLRLSCYDSCTLAMRDLYSLLLAEFLAILELVPVTAAVADLLAITKDTDFDAQLFSIQVKSMVC